MAGAVRSENLKIIDDLTTDIDNLCIQMRVAQDSLHDSEIIKSFEDLMKTFKAHNDTLLTEYMRMFEGKQLNSDRILQIQNEELKSRICENEEEIAKLRKKVFDLDVRTSMPNPTDGSDSRRSTVEETLHVCNLQESCSADVCKSIERQLGKNNKAMKDAPCSKYDQADKNKDKCCLKRREHSSDSCRWRPENEEKTKQHDKCKDPAKEIRKLKKENMTLLFQIDELKASECSLKKERDLLQVEIMALKEASATQAGTQMGQQDQIQSLLKELDDTKVCLYDNIRTNKELEACVASEVKRFQELKAEMYCKYNNLVEDYNNVLTEYQKLVQIEKEKTKQIESFNAWKCEQAVLEKDIQRKMAAYEKHIQDLVYEKQELFTKLCDLQDENQILIDTMHSSRVQTNDSYMQETHTHNKRKAKHRKRCPSADPVSKVIENVRDASRRLSQRRLGLEEENSCYME